MQAWLIQTPVPIQIILIFPSIRKLTAAPVTVGTGLEIDFIGWKHGGIKKGTSSFLSIPYSIVAGATRRELATFPLDYPTIHLPVVVCLISTGEPILYHEEGNPYLVLS